MRASEEIIQMTHASMCARNARVATVGAALVGLLIAAGPATAQLSGAGNSTAGASCSGAGSADGDCRNSVGFSVPNNGTTFTSRYAWNVNADIGVFSTHDTSGSAQHNVSFTATAPGGYRLDIGTSRVGDINRVNDASGCDGSADTSGVTGSSNIALNAGTLSLGDPGSIGNGGSTGQVPFSQSGSATIFRASNGVGQGHTLTFTWNGSARSNSCEAAVRQGENSGTTTGCSACAYPGSPGRTQSSDGHFVTVTYTSLCGNGTVEGLAGEQCDEGANNGLASSCCTSICQLKAAGTLCRAAAGVCDNAEECNGETGACPNDSVFGAFVTCRPTAGPCDVAENCDGVGVNCPADGFASTAVVCRGAAGECDLADNCPGNSAACSPDAKKSSGTPCTSDGNVCTDDQCNGISNACQHPNNTAPCTDGLFCNGADTCSGGTCSAHAGDPCTGGAECNTQCNEAGDNCFNSNGTPCSSDGNPCTVDQCNGLGSCNHPAGNPGTLCRAAAGVCDVPESCVGANTECPADSVAGAFVECRATAGECDPAENCDGVGVDCPPDAKDPSGTPCTSDGNVCTDDECDGVNDDCQHPAGNAGTECRPSAGPCDVAEDCTGSNPNCPADGVASTATVCRPSAGVCDTADNCDGVNVTCPADAKSTAVCRPDAGDCDVPESCDGVGDACPADQTEPDGTACVDGNACTVDECQGGVCVGTPDFGACLDDMMCYKSKNPQGHPKFVVIASVPLADSFESGPFDLKKPKHLCPPADRTPSSVPGIFDPDTHLLSYKIKPSLIGGPIHTPRTNIQVVNEIGSIRVDTKKAELLLVPTAKDLGSPPVAPNPLLHNVDHFKCYTVKITKGTPKFPRGVQAVTSDQFTSPPKRYDLKKVKLLCKPVDKNGEGIKNAARHMLCYVAKPALGEPLHTPVTPFLANQFPQPTKVSTIKEDLLCVPSEIAP